MKFLENDSQERNSGLLKLPPSYINENKLIKINDMCMCVFGK